MHACRFRRALQCHAAHACQPPRSCRRTSRLTVRALILTPHAADTRQAFGGQSGLASRHCVARLLLRPVARQRPPPEQADHAWGGGLCRLEICVPVSSAQARKCAGQESDVLAPFGFLDSDVKHCLPGPGAAAARSTRPRGSPANMLAMGLRHWLPKSSDFDRGGRPQPDSLSQQQPAASGRGAASKLAGQEFEVLAPLSFLSSTAEVVRQDSAASHSSSRQ